MHYKNSPSSKPETKWKPVNWTKTIGTIKQVIFKYFKYLEKKKFKYFKYSSDFQIHFQVQKINSSLIKCFKYLLTSLN